MDEFWIALAAGLAVAVIVAAAAWARKPIQMAITNWWQSGTNQFAESAKESEQEQLQTLRDQVAERARRLEKRLPVSASGNRVTYTDGHTATYIADFQTYRRMMQRCQVDPMRTFNRPPPTPLDRRDRDWLEQWLHDNPEP